MPNSSACSGVTRPVATGRCSVREPMSASMSRSSTWLSADAPPHASASPSIVTPKKPERRNSLGADEHPGRAGEEQQRHDPRLRQRDVVAKSRERRRLAAERTRDDDQTEAERGRRGAHVQCRRPGRIPAPRDDAPEGDRDEEGGERHDAPDEECGIREPRQHDVRHEQGQSDERDPPVRRPELEHGADDDEPDRRRRPRPSRAGRAPPARGRGEPRPYCSRSPRCSRSLLRRS